ncbi:DNA-directed RNA polymerase subunit omega [Candidatus Cyanaurora vandensis]|uniref:DNA-directed RNA polymerase subunit omega n=1 Tax=Candidatus Cyanaurora vandensis TaxID=2714958 RepID=UPI002579625A|nr:DNA-directed RNA polymerase subunit omega [Candidatus Cyanaurora vandensis]
MAVPDLTTDHVELMRRTETVITAAENRYRITVQIAQRAKRRHFEESTRDEDEDGHIKPVVQAIYEMSEELLTPEILAD